MFKRNDYSAIVWMIILIVFFIFELIISFAIGVWLMSKTTEDEKFWFTIGLAVTITGWVMSGIVFIFFRLILSFICDIKLIRNKLYGEENTNLMIYFAPLKEIFKRKDMGKIKDKKVDLEKNTDSNKQKVKRKIKINISTIIITVSLLVALATLIFIFIMLLIR